MFTNVPDQMFDQSLLKGKCQDHRTFIIENGFQSISGFLTFTFVLETPHVDLP